MAFSDDLDNNNCELQFLNSFYEVPKFTKTRVISEK